jgi:hypothetical protein
VISASCRPASVCDERVGDALQVVTERPQAARAEVVRKTIWPPGAMAMTGKSSRWLSSRCRRINRSASSRIFLDSANSIVCYVFILAASASAVAFAAGQLAARVVDARSPVMAGEAIGGSLVALRIFNFIQPIVAHAGFSDRPDQRSEERGQEQQDPIKRRQALRCANRALFIAPCNRVAPAGRPTHRPTYSRRPC